MKLIAHVNGDDDLLDAWFAHYTRLGVTSFHLIVHGPWDQNRRLHELLGAHPITVEDHYEGEFLSTEKLRRITSVLEPMRGQWIVWVDSDEFLELPHPDLPTTVRAMERLHTDVLIAPFVQRIREGGILDSPDRIDDPFAFFPRCSVDLYRHMGVEAALTKHPVLYWDHGTVLSDGGNHGLPYGSRGRPAPFLGATHHFKWRRSVRERIEVRAAGNHPWRHESAGFASYLAGHDWRLPVEGSFPYSPEAMREHGLVGVPDRRRHALRWLLSRLPESLDDRAMAAISSLGRRRGDDG